MSENKENLLLENCKPSEAVEYFGPTTLLAEIDDEDIAEYVEDCDWILRAVDDKTLIDAISDENEIFNSLCTEDLVTELEDRGYAVIDPQDDEDVLTKIKNICRELQPNGYIGKEEAKKILCDYIDFWMNNSF